jgi:hypothetical protein
MEHGSMETTMSSKPAARAQHFPPADKDSRKRRRAFWQNEPEVVIDDKTAA